MSRVRVLFCDDSAGVQRGFESEVARPLEPFLECKCASSVAGVQRLIAQGEAFDVVVSDLNFEKVGGGPKDGLEILRLAREHWPGVEPVLLTAYEGALDVRDGLRLRSLGLEPDALLAKTDAEDPGTTWLRLRERLAGLAQRRRAGDAREEALRRENRYLREGLAERTRSRVVAGPLSEVAAAIAKDPELCFHGQIGQSFAMREVFRRVRRAAGLGSDVLILGPTGTGKDLVARALHDLSPRAAAPFVKADLMANSAQLVESELFGHERGAFTGADQRKEGLLAAAQGGTFFLDEIGNVPAETQAKLLRVLEDRRYRPLGSTKERVADVRVVAATNEDLEDAVAAGRFRADLYERLNVLRVRLPALVERAEDVPLLVAWFVAQARERLHAEGLDRIEPDALALLEEQPWPRNVRQLKHVVERLFSELDTDAPTIDREAVLRSLDPPATGRGGGARRSSPAESAAASGGELLRRVLAGEVSAPLSELKKRFGEEAVKELIARAMLHFRGLPGPEECDQYFGGSSPNAWRQFAYQLGLTWRAVRAGRAFADENRPRGGDSPP